MPPGISRTLRSRWFIGCVHAGMWVLLYLAISNIRGRAFDYHESDSATAATLNPVPTGRLETLFSAAGWAKFSADTNNLNPFLTRYFMPRETAPPTTRKIEVTYQGFYQTADGPVHAVYKLGDAFVASAVGTKVTANLFIADANMHTLTLTNTASQTNVIPLNVKKELEVPIQ